MDSIVEAKVKNYLIRRWHYNPHDCGTIVECMTALARVGGGTLDDHFALAGLGAGPEARIASGIVDRALLGGGCQTSEYEIRAQINEWIRRFRRKGR
jgi:hypothetical protein